MQKKGRKYGANGPLELARIFLGWEVVCKTKVKRVRKINEELKLLDVVALLEDIPSLKLHRGEVGMIVEEFEDGAVEVEFSDKRGVAYAFADLPKSKLLAHHTIDVAEEAV